MSTKIIRDKRSGLVGVFNKEKAGHYETLRRFVGSSNNLTYNSYILQGEVSMSRPRHNE